MASDIYFLWSVYLYECKCLKMSYELVKKLEAVEISFFENNVENMVDRKESNF